MTAGLTRPENFRYPVNRSAAADVRKEAHAA